MRWIPPYQPKIAWFLALLSLGALWMHSVSANPPEDATGALDKLEGTVHKSDGGFFADAIVECFGEGHKSASKSGTDGSYACAAKDGARYRVFADPGRGQYVPGMQDHVAASDDADVTVTRREILNELDPEDDADLIRRLCLAARWASDEDAIGKLGGCS